MKSKYVITCIEFSGEGISDYDKTLYWDNTKGWGDLSNATVYNQLERDSFSLPLGDSVVWELLPQTFSYTETNIVRNALAALKVLALSNGDEYLENLSDCALEILE